MSVTVTNVLRRLVVAVLLVGTTVAAPRPARAQAQPSAFAAQVEPARAGAPRPEGGEASLIVPGLNQVEFRGINATTWLMGGLLVSALGLLFGLMTFMGLKALPVHESMREVSELIYQTCKTYLITQGKFILRLWAFIAIVIAAYFGWLSPVAGKPVA